MSAIELRNKQTPAITKVTRKSPKWSINIPFKIGKVNIPPIATIAFILKNEFSLILEKVSLPENIIHILDMRKFTNA